MIATEFNGKYFGTEVEGKWWKRCTRHGLLARGNGKLSIDDESICFHRLLTREPVRIRFDEVVGVEEDRWHAGQWGARSRVLKVIWQRDGKTLTSGFSVSSGFSALMFNIQCRLAQASE
ncbi:hypothetical protein [Hydrogenophaga sp. 5NK40-0174]|uniref:PH-like domain-containing protein n=1 Tax=Hydrogenophaga sp. 5NK40-0174 TaxID=3127649 RepID=UPI0031092EAD